MHATIRAWYGRSLLILLTALFLLYSPLWTSTSYASTKFAPWTGKVLSWAHIRTAPATNAGLAATYAPNMLVTVYAVVPGQAVWSGLSTWDRISSLSSKPLYIYSGLVLPTANNRGGSVAHTAKGKEIVISLARQWMYVYQDGSQVYTSPITTGRPELATPTGTFHVFAKLHPTTFYSRWAPGSPYWYPPTHINYALAWNVGGYFLHDSWWRTVYGPGTNVWHYDPVYGEQSGTHGCITMPLKAAIWLYNWTPIGTTVEVIA